MRPVFRTSYRIKTYFSTMLENSLLPINNGGPTVEVLIVRIEIPGPVWPGERWNLYADYTGQNPGHETGGTFMRSEIWIDPDPDIPQTGHRSQTLRQTGTYNLGQEAEFQQVYREGEWQFNNAVLGSQWVKLFCGANGTQSLPDNVMQNAAVGVKRMIPL